MACGEPHMTFKFLDGACGVFFFPCLKDSICFTVGFQSTLSVKTS